LPRAGAQVALQLLALPEPPRGLDDELHAELLPRDARRILLLDEPAHPVPRDELAVPRGDRQGEFPHDRVVLEQVGERPGAADVVARPRAALGGLGQEAEPPPPDPPEAADADADPPPPPPRAGAGRPAGIVAIRRARSSARWA